MSEAVRIKKALKQILGYWGATLVPAGRPDAPRVRGSKEAPMPTGANILDARAMTCSRMFGWCKIVIEDRDLHTEGINGLDIKGMADLLERHADWLGEHEAAADVVDELEASARELRAIAYPTHREWMSIGTCPLEVDSPDGPVVCGGQVRAYHEKDPKCQKCKVEAVTGWWEERMFTNPELRKLLTAAELVTFIHAQFGRPVTQVAIRQWISRGIIAKADTDDKGRSLYDKGAVAYALERRKILA